LEPDVIYSYEMRNVAAGTRIGCGLFTSDDLPEGDPAVLARAYVEQRLADEHVSTATELRLWNQHLTSWSLLGTVPPDETWTVDPPEVPDEPLV
jgi:hypothetical protein